MFFLPGPARGIGDIGSCLGRKMTGGHCTNVFLLLLVRRSPCDHHALLWMNEWCIHIVLYFVLLYTKSLLQSCAGSLLNHHQCAASTWMMRRLPQDNGASALTTHQLQVERRESHRANQVDGEAMIEARINNALSHIVTISGLSMLNSKIRARQNLYMCCFVYTVLN